MRNWRCPIGRQQLLLAGALSLLQTVAAQELPADRLPQVPAEDFAGQTACPVVKVLAGNEVVVQRDGQPVTVRLIGAYVPQTDPAAEQARTFTARLLEGESVYLESEPDWPQPDSTGRIWAYVYRAPDGLLVNLELVRQGYARVSAGGPFRHQSLMEAYERLARQNHKGLWSRPGAESRPSSDSTGPAAGRSSGPREPPTGEIVVYVTQHGRKYHRKDCQYVKSGAKAISLKEAKQQGLEPCSKCKPPK